MVNKEGSPKDRSLRTKKKSMRHGRAILHAAAYGIEIFSEIICNRLSLIQ